MKSGLALLLTVAMATCAFGATAVATYRFDNNFNADQGGVPALTAVDPLGTSSFTTDVVLGVSRQVWAFNGNTTPSEQSGLTLNTTGLAAPENYSVDMVFEFIDHANDWSRILDVQNRQSDNGFYVNPANNLDIFPASGSSAAWSNNVYHHVVLTNDGTTVNAYLDGISQFAASTSVMNLDNLNNPSLLMGLFLDNVVGGGQGEYARGRIGLFRLWDGVLSSSEAQALANNPFVPEPSSFVLAALALIPLSYAARRRARRLKVAP